MKSVHKSKDRIVDPFPDLGFFSVSSHSRSRRKNLPPVLCNEELSVGDIPKIKAQDEAIARDNKDSLILGPLFWERPSRWGFTLLPEC
jgi:hypothetical protein